MKIYISGPITGMPNNNREAFEEAEEHLRRCRFDVYNPLKEVPAHANRSIAMRLDLQALLTCDGVALLEGHMDSPGSNVEKLVARACNMAMKSWALWNSADSGEAA